LSTNPPKRTDGGVGYFEKMSYKADSYIDKTTYLGSQPIDQRKSGFGSHDASRRDEFTTGIRTEQYREQLKSETEKTVKLASDPQIDEGDALDELVSPTKKTFLFDIGRTQQTEFDPRSSKDTFYNALECKSRIRQDRNNGPYMVSSQKVGEGTKGLDHAQCRPMWGHVKSTKEFNDHSHLGQSKEY